MKKILTILALLLSITAQAEPMDDTPILNGQFGQQRLGIAVSPKNLPNHSPQDLQDAFIKARKVGKHAIFIFQWGRFKPRWRHRLLNKVERMILCQ